MHYNHCVCSLLICFALHDTNCKPTDGLNILVACIHKHIRLGAQETFLPRAPGWLSEALQMDQRFNEEDHHVHCLVPSLFLHSSVKPDEYINDMLKLEKDLLYPKSLGSEVRRWKELWMNIMVKWEFLTKK